MKLVAENVDEFAAKLRSNLLASLEEVLGFELKEFFDHHENHDVYFAEQRVPAVLVAVGCYTCDDMSLYTVERQYARISEALARRDMKANVH